MTSNVAYLFDIDGTLTPSRQAINPEFHQKFMRFQFRETTYLVTGSDFEKTLDQVGFQVIFSAKKTFHCCGNEGRQQGKVFYRNEWTPSSEVVEYLNMLLTRSKFPIEDRTSRFIEYRAGSINFSIVGRAANIEQRQ
jgi:phosphomannomutase